METAIRAHRCATVNLLVTIPRYQLKYLYHHSFYYVQCSCFISKHEIVNCSQIISKLQFWSIFVILDACILYLTSRFHCSRSNCVWTEYYINRVSLRVPWYWHRHDYNPWKHTLTESLKQRRAHGSKYTRIHSLALYISILNNTVRETDTDMVETTVYENSPVCI